MPGLLRLSESAARAFAALDESERRIAARALTWLDTDPRPNGVSRRRLEGFGDDIHAVYGPLIIVYREDPDDRYTVVHIVRYIEEG